jgi:flagellar biosynthesis protein FlhA
MTVAALPFHKSAFSMLRASAQGILLPVASIALVLLMVVPVPALALDIFFIANIMISLIVLMLALNSTKPLDFSSFPTILLFTTLFRLSLNVASTRVVLVDGHKGAAAAGHVIEAFGDFIIGGNFVVGIFVFAILVIINLVVIAKGAGRVSEVSARFTLDALPGKQMAVDADLNAGLLTPDEAKKRRQEVTAEADFYGSMDGASKFVKGDAIAGLIILFINIVGGLIIGITMHDLSVGVAAETYIILSVGDALVAQIPSLLLSIAAAAIVTRVSSPLDLSGQINQQFRSVGAWGPVAGMMFLLGIIPGMPHFIILPFAAISGFIAYRIHTSNKKAASEPTPVVATTVSSDSEQIHWDEVFEDTIVGLELGFGLLGLIDERQPAPLVGRLTAIRKQLSKELGFIVPNIRVRDNLSLTPFGYRLIIAGTIVGADEVWPQELLALDPGDTVRKVSGRPVKDPTYGMDALWIAAEDRQEAIAAGYTVVDPATVIATHLSRILAENARQLLSQDIVQKMLDTLQVTAPQLVGSLVPKTLTLQALTLTLQNLLEEGLPIREFRLIMDAVTAVVHRTQDGNQISELIRPALGSLLVQRVVGLNETLKVITLDADLEKLLTDCVKIDPVSPFPFEASLCTKIVLAVQNVTQDLTLNGIKFAVVTAPLIRRQIYNLLRHQIAACPVLSFYELSDTRKLEIIATIGRSEPSEGMTNNA